MRRKSVWSYLVVAVMMVVAACAGFQVAADHEQVALVGIKATARIAGYEFAKKMPGSVESAKVVCNQVLAADTTAAAELLVNRVYQFAEADPLVMATVSDMLTLIDIDIDVSPFPAEKIPRLRAAAQGFLEGVAIAGMKGVSAEGVVLLIKNDPKCYEPGDGGYFTVKQLVALYKADEAAARFYVETVLDSLTTAASMIGVDLLNLSSPCADDTQKVIDHCLKETMAKASELGDKPAHLVVWFVASVMCKPSV